MTHHRSLGRLHPRQPSAPAARAGASPGAVRGTTQITHMVSGSGFSATRYEFTYRPPSVSMKFNGVRCSTPFPSAPAIAISARRVPFVGGPDAGRPATLHGVTRSRAADVCLNRCKALSARLRTTGADGKGVLHLTPLNFILTEGGRYVNSYRVAEKPEPETMCVIWVVPRTAPGA